MIYGIHVGGAVPLSNVSINGKSVSAKKAYGSVDEHSAILEEALECYERVINSAKEVRFYDLLLFFVVIFYLFIQCISIYLYICIYVYVCVLFYYLFLLKWNPFSSHLFLFCQQPSQAMKEYARVSSLMGTHRQKVVVLYINI